MEIHDRLQSLDFIVLGVYIASLIGIGIFVGYSRRAEDDQFLAGRTFGWFNVGLSIFATNINPSFLIASAAAAYTTGMVTANFEWMAWPFLMLLAMVFAPHYLTTKISTMPQFVHRRFGSKASEFLSWYALLSTVVLWLGGALYAGGLLLSQIMGWSLAASVTALMAVSVFLTVAGGLAVVMVTDSFQSILMLAGTATLTLLGLYELGGIDRLIEAVPPERWTLFRPSDDPDYPWHAMVLGYPVLGVWFWCTDQTIVQRMLGARNLRQGQIGAMFTGFLKILTPFLFVMPGFICYVLHPNLDDPNEAFMTMVSRHMPVGMVGLIIAVLVAALISTIDSGLNSFSTIFTLDIYQKKLKPNASPAHIKRVGRIVTVLIGFISIGIALSMETVGKNLFDLIQSIIAYFAPPMAAVFLVGILWKRATATAAIMTLVVGSTVSLSIGMVDFFKEPIMACLSKRMGMTVELAMPHFLMMSFYLFVGITVFMIGVSLLTKNADYEEPLPSLAEVYRQSSIPTGRVWLGWMILAAIMTGIYLVFD